MGVLIWFLAIISTTVAASNRTFCFKYVDCYEAAQSAFKNCAGGTGISLTLESKDRTVTDLLKGRSQIISGCQDHLLKEIVDFDALQVLVLQDSRECFEKLPERRKPLDVAQSETCDYVIPEVRDNYGKDTYQCATEYLEDRTKCEDLLSCCSDHTRCAERMNAVSIPYREAKTKSLQIVSNLLSCVESRDPSSNDVVGKLRRQRSSLRNGGLPFFRPDLATEERIYRRLALTSAVTFEQRTHRFTKRYNEIRNIMSKKIEEATTEPKEPATDDRKITMIKNLLKNADDSDLAVYVSLISEGNFEKLSELEKEKLLKLDTEDDINAAMNKMGTIKSAIKSALTNKQQKTLEYAIQSQLPKKNAEEILEETHVWNDEEEKKVVNEVLGKALENVDDDTLFRAKKFASAVEDALVAQKELILTKDDTFNGNGLAQQRTSVMTKPTEEDKVHEFETLKGEVEEPSSFVKPSSGLALSDVHPLSKAEMVSYTNKPVVETTEAVEGSGDVAEGSGDVEEHNNVEAENLTQDDVFLTRRETADENEASENDHKEKHHRRHRHHKHKSGEDSEEKHHHRRHHKKHHHHKKNKSSSSNSSSSESNSSSGSHEDDKTTTTPSTTTTSATTTTATEPTTTTTSTTTSTTTTTAAPTTASNGEIHIPTADEKPSDDKKDNKRNVEELINDTDKDRAEFVEKLANLKRKLAKIDAISQVPANTAKEQTTIGHKEEKLLTSMITDMKTNLEEQPEKTIEDVEPIVEESSTTITTVAPSSAEEEPNFCSEYAQCNDLAFNYENQCQNKFSEDVLSHGIEDNEIVNILYNHSISQHEIVMKACIRPFDKTSYGNLKQLLVVERGVRRACLALGHNRAIISNEDLAQCETSLPATGEIDNFLAKHDARNENNRLSCLAKVEALRQTCENRSKCCASLTPCDKYINQSPIQKLKQEAIDTLVQRQQACEERMMDTLKYIHDNLTSRRRRLLRS